MDKDKEKIRDAVRQNYAKVAESASRCGCSSSSCCGSDNDSSVKDISINLGYSPEDLAKTPDGANMGLGCGNPQAIASLKHGEVVLDLGSGGGFDCFLSARVVGESGKVIGVDMTPEMISKARENAQKSMFKNVEFRLGELENLPVADGVVDIIISNCVINLSPEKDKVFKEAFRVLKTGGRIAISDIVANSEIPQQFKNDMKFYSSCAAGAATILEIKNMLEIAGFRDIKIVTKPESKTFIKDWLPDSGIENYVVSATIEAKKP